MWDQDQTRSICFQVAGVALTFISDGSEKHKAISALLISAFVAAKTISYDASANPLRWGSEGYRDRSNSNRAADDERL